LLSIDHVKPDQQRHDMQLAVTNDGIAASKSCRLHELFWIGEKEETMSNHEHVYPPITPELAKERSRIAPAQAKAFRAFSDAVFAEGALPATTKQLIAVAVAHVTQCPYCIRSHTAAAIRERATAEQIMEAIWVAAEMRAGAAYAHSAIALDAIAALAEKQSGRAG
jgi:AhpD family alkylhydroperoxidase